MRYAIKSKKTGKTYLRQTGYGRYDWVMFREEGPSSYPSMSDAGHAIPSMVNPEECEIVQLDSVPFSDPIHAIPLHIANWYSENGKHQVLASIYDDEAILFLQVATPTADMLRTPLSTIEGIDQLFPAMQSDDGMTWVWTFRRGQGIDGDWLVAFMGRMSPILSRYLIGLLRDGLMEYIDNRTRDANTIESFAKLCQDAMR